MTKIRFHSGNKAVFRLGESVIAKPNQMMMKTKMRLIAVKTLGSLVITAMTKVQMKTTDDRPKCDCTKALVRLGAT